MEYVLIIWAIGFVISALAFYFKDMRGKYVGGSELIFKLVVCLCPSLNLGFGLWYFSYIFVIWAIDAFKNRCGRLIWDRTKFKWIANKDTNNE